MKDQVCVSCHNKNPVNLTNNRLVTESCGHVKCLHCLFEQISGCAACKHTEAQVETIDPLEPESSPEVDSATVKSEPRKVYDETAKNVKDLFKKDVNSDKNPENSHIEIRTDANGTRCYVCVVCDKTFYARSNVPYHKYCREASKPFQCQECKKTFVTASHFKYHMAVHYNDKTYKCEDCGQCFFQMSKLKRHRLKHTHEKRHRCTECGKSFDNQTSLRRHALTHAAQHAYECETCGAKFRDVSNYSKHTRRHDIEGDGNDSIICEICGITESSRAALLAHCKAVHTLKPYHCLHCDQAFHFKKDLRRHSQVHTDSKPYRCKVCNRRFRRKDNHDRHIRNTHGAEPGPAEEPDDPLTANGRAPSQINDKLYESDEKTKLEILNPLPPVPEEVMQKHMHTTKTKEMSNGEPVIDTSYILAANNARESVICKGVGIERKVPSPVQEYVHKIRKANSMVSQKDMPLPPIDEEKLKSFLQVEPRIIDVGPLGPLYPKNIQLYKNILGFGPSANRSADNEEDAKVDSNAGPTKEMHWRKKKLNINW